jgi:sec-independent protein translocase protein TatA
MGSLSIWHWLVVLAVVLLLFGGKGKISALMGDVGKGLKSFKQGIKDNGSDGEAEADQSKRSVADDSAAVKPASKSDQAVNG